MKILQITVLCFLVSSAYAQILRIDTCFLYDKDSASVVPPRNDINDTPCSIVKILAKNIVGALNFKGNIVGDVIKEDSIYTIYLIDKTKRLKVYHADYIPETIDFTSYEQSRTGVEGERVYCVIISGQKEENESNVFYPKGSRVLAFFTNRKLQSLVVDGIEWKPLNENTVKRLLPYGLHKYNAVCDTGQHLEGEVELLPAIGSKIVKLNFPHQE